MKVVLIIPTYNEAGNIVRLVDLLEVQLEKMAHDAHVLVVDDNSPDGTADLVRDIQKRYANVHLISGEKAGLGAAYIRGMRHAVEELGAEVVFEMDADFSHKPEDVPRLMAEIDAGADFVIGSRYVDGGSIPSEWGLHRRLISIFGNIVARYVTGIYKVRDCTAGFRAIRVSLLRLISLDELRVQGYAFQVALLHEAKIRKADIREIPVEFVERSAGNSKLGLSDIIEFLTNALSIRLRSSRTFIKFSIVGLTGVVVNLTVFSVLLQLGLNKYISSPIAIEVSIISNFLANNYWTFRWRHTVDKLRLKGLKFNMVSLLTLSVSYSTFIAVSAALPDLPPTVPQLISIAPAMLLNYMMNAYWTFRNVDPKTEEQKL